jgi:MFS family permease
MWPVKELSFATKGWALAALGTGAFATMWLLTMMSPMLPTLVQAFHTDVNSIQWAVLAYSLTMASTMVSFGRLGDLAGRKKVYVAGFVVLAVGSLLGALAKALVPFLASRVVQGIGASLIVANNLALLSEVFPPRERGAAVAFNLTLVALGSLIAPTLAGLLISTAGWQANFYLLAVVSLAGAAVSWKRLADTPALSQESLDLWGALTFAAAIASITVVMNQGPRLGWSSGLVLAAAAAASAAVVLFWWASRRSPRPLLDGALLRNRTFSLSNACLFLAGLSTAAINFVLPFFLQVALGFSPAAMGLLLAAGPAVQMLLSPLSGRLTDRLGFWIPSTLGVTMDVLAALWLSAAAPGQAILWLILRLALVGVGPGLLQTPNQTAVMGSAPSDRAGMASGFLGTMRHLGMITGVASVGTFFSLRSAHYAALAGGNTAAGFAAGFREAMWVVAAANALGVLLSAARARPHLEQRA